MIAVAGAGAVLLAIRLPARWRAVAIGVALAGLLAAPASWAGQTLGHATSSTFPAGGPASASIGGFGGPGGGGLGGGFRAHRGFPGAGGSGGFGARGFSGSGAPGARGQVGPAAPGGPGGPAGFGARGFGGAGGLGGAGGPGGAGGLGGLGARGLGGPGGFGGGGGMFGGDSTVLKAAISYARAHGGGTIGVESQSSAAAAIVSSNADVAGLGGFSGRESSVSASWIAMEVRHGRLRWVMTEGSQPGGFPGRGDTRRGSAAALSVVAKACRAVSFTSSGSKVTMYDCQGRSAAILSTAAKS